MAGNWPSHDEGRQVHLWLFHLLHGRTLCAGELASVLGDFSRATVTCRSFPADDRGHEAEGVSGCRAATDTVPSHLHAAEAETREEVQERLALRTCERGH